MTVPAGGAVFEIPPASQPAAGRSSNLFRIQDGWKGTFMSRLVAIAICSIGFLALGGCVSTRNVPLKSDSLASREGGTIMLSYREKPAFAASTAGKAVFGVMGAFAAIGAGNQLVKDNNVPDPAEFIGAQLLGDVAALNGLKLGPKSTVVASSTDTAQLAKLYRNADVLLDVQTVNWSLGYFPTDWNSYRVMYSAKARIIETRSGKLLAESFCARIPDKTADAPSYDQLTSNNAAGLKAELTKAAQHCLGEFRSKLLGT
jgi:hypothetical protein